MEGARARDRGRGTGLVLLLCFGILLTGCLVQFVAGYSHVDASAHARGMDDAYISYRYARNLAEGEGVVFNGGERVEGYTNFLYVLLMSGAYKLVGERAIYTASVALNFLFVTAAFFLFYWHVRDRLERRATRAAVFLFVLCPGLWLWVGSGMETMLVLLIQLAVLFGAERIVAVGGRGPLILTCVAMGLSILVRADGFIVPAIAIVYLLMRRAWRPAIYAATVTATVAAAYFSWRLAYYGYPLPNTYYAKVTGPLTTRVLAGFRQLVAMALHGGMFPYVVVFGALTFEWLRRSLREPRVLVDRVPMVGLFTAGWIGYWLYVGGDQLGERFMIVLFPLGVYALLRYIGPKLQTRALVLLVVVLAVLQLAPLDSDPRFAFKQRKYDMWVTLGLHLGKTHEGSTLAIDAAGKVPFYSRLETIDMLGLNNEFLAHAPPGPYELAGHRKYDPDYVFSREPDLIAAWVKPDLGLHWGLERLKYERAGYRLRYLVNSNKHAARENVVDVSRRNEAVIRQLLGAGFRYGVLERVDKPDLSTRLN